MLKLTFKLNEREINDICNALTKFYVQKEKEPLWEKIQSICAWIQTMPAEDRHVYLLGRKT